MSGCPVCEGWEKSYPGRPQCSDPWHFWGWFWKSNTPAMVQAARELCIPLRVGEQTLPSTFTRVDNTVEINVPVYLQVFLNLSAFWWRVEQLHTIDSEGK